MEKTRTIRTGKGLHFCYTAPDFEVKSDADVGGIPGLDVRGEGGYVIAPGSPHQSGKRYTVMDPTVDPQPLPSKLYDFLKEHCSKDSERPSDNGQQTGRNTAITKEVGRLFAQGLSEDRVREEAHAYNVNTYDPPLPSDEVETSVRSIAKAEASKKAQREATKPNRPVKVVCIADVQQENLRWMWERRIPYGKVSLIQGDPGLGKSMITLAIAAAVTRGKTLPEGPALDTGNVLVLACEDGVADTIKPRFVKAGGDEQRFFVALGVGTDGEDALSLPNDIPELKKIMVEKQIALLIIDPLSAYVAGKIDSYKDADMRRLLTPLSKLAEETGAAIIAIRHLNKGTGSALQRGLGSVATGAAARSVLHVAEDPVDESWRILVGVKTNVSGLAKSLRFRVLDTGQIEWGGFVDYTAKDLVAQPLQNDQSKGSEIDAIITKCLASGPKPKKDVMDAMSDAGLTVDERTVRRHILNVGGTLEADGKTGMWGLAGQVDNSRSHVQLVQNDDQAA
jgi:hypothetical protein